MNMTMKHSFISRFGSLALISVAVLAQFMPAVVAHAASITLGIGISTIRFTWSARRAVTKNCVTGFQYDNHPDGGTTPVKIGIAPNPATTAASGSTSVSVQFTKGPLGNGPVIFYARTMGLDPNGNVIYSAVASPPSSQIMPASPSNLVITVK